MTNDKPHTLSVERIETLTKGDMLDLCDATFAAIETGGGFGWVEMPEREALQRYWNGVVAVPQRDLFIARMNKAVVGTVQLMRFPPNNQAQSFSAQVTGFFIAPWARGQGLGQMLLELVESRAKEMGLYALNIDVRETQNDAIRLFQKMGYTQWGMNPVYAFVKGRSVPGYFFHKIIQPMPGKKILET